MRDVTAQNTLAEDTSHQEREFAEDRASTITQPFALGEVATMLWLVIMVPRSGAWLQQNLKDVCFRSA